MQYLNEMDFCRRQKCVSKSLRACRLRFLEKANKIDKIYVHTSVADFCFILVPCLGDHFRSRAEIIVSFSLHHQNSHVNEKTFFWVLTFGEISWIFDFYLIGWNELNAMWAPKGSVWWNLQILIGLKKFLERENTEILGKNLGTDKYDKRNSRSRRNVPQTK